jgi:hypothetical protein
MIHATIIRVLEDKPNNSCPRKILTKRVDEQIDWMDGKKNIEIYMVQMNGLSWDGLSIISEVLTWREI